MEFATRVPEVGPFEVMVSELASVNARFCHLDQVLYVFWDGEQAVPTAYRTERRTPPDALTPRPRGG